MYLLFGKRIFDTVVSLVALIVLLPVLLFVAVAILVTQGRPVLFRQVRPGRNARPFTMIKFCSMTQGRDKDGRLCRDSERLTKLGGFLRSTSLDELPELWNILKGEMSLVGPRPLLSEYVARYTDEQMRRHNVRPGVTGWAQVHGRQTLVFSKRLEFDTWYVDNCSLLLDAKIMCMTLSQVFVGKGVILGQEVEDVDDIGLSKSIDVSIKPEH